MVFTRTTLRSVSSNEVTESSDEYKAVADAYEQDLKRKYRLGLGMVILTTAVDPNMIQAERIDG